MRAIMAGVVVAVVAVATGRATACTTDLDCATLNPCDGMASCVDGACHYAPPNCDDHVACTIDGCSQNRGGCFHDPLCPDDGLVCNGKPRCLKNPITFQTYCAPALPPSCDDANACTVDGCAEPTGCQHTPVDCNDGNPCTTDGCDTGVGCLHQAVPGCCRSSDDCPVDKCHARPCQGNVCTGDPLPISCDDKNPQTVDACDLALGCTHTDGEPTTTTTTQPSGGCREDADCPADADPCVRATCEGGTCVGRPAGGFDALACVCRRADPASCAGQPLPHAVVVRRAHACTLVGTASAGGKKARKLVGRAARLLLRAQKTLGAAKHVAPACVQSLGGVLRDDEERAQTVRSQL